MLHPETKINDHYNAELSRVEGAADALLASRRAAAASNDPAEQGRADADARMASGDAQRALGALEALERLADDVEVLLIQDRRRSTGDAVGF